METFGIIVAAVASATLGFFTAGLIAITLMNAIGYDLSLVAMIRFVRHENNGGHYSLDERVGRQAIAININSRVVMTLFVYVLMASGLLLAALKLNKYIIVICLFAALIGLLINCVFAVINEYSFWPFILRYEGFDGEKEVHLKKIILDEGDEPDAEIILDLDEASCIDEDVNRGEIIVLLVPPATDRDMIYERMF